MNTRPVLKDSKIVLAGVARNCARTLASDLAVLEAAFSAAAAISILVIESDSSDGTVAELVRLAREDRRLRYVSLGALQAKLPQRTERIAFCRNRYLQELEWNPDLAETTYLVVADLDGVNSRLTADAVATCWNLPLHWDVCAANQRDFYYDVWALRAPGWCPDDCWQLYRRLCPIMGREQALQIAVHSRMVHLDTAAAPVEVQSAFGGLAIYRREFLHGARYCGSDLSGAVVSEHIGLHRQITDAGGRIYINPALINAHATRHSWNKKFVANAARQLFPGLYRPDPGGVEPRSPLARRLQLLRDAIG